MRTSGKLVCLGNTLWSGRELAFRARMLVQPADLKVEQERAWQMNWGGSALRGEPSVEAPHKPHSASWPTLEGRRICHVAGMIRGLLKSVPPLEALNAAEFPASGMFSGVRPK